MSIQPLFKTVGCMSLLRHKKIYNNHYNGLLLVRKTSLHDKKMARRCTSKMYACLVLYKNTLHLSIE